MRDLGDDAHVGSWSKREESRADEISRLSADQKESLALIYEQRGVIMSCRPNPKPTFQLALDGTIFGLPPCGAAVQRACARVSRYSWRTTLPA